MGMAIMGSDWAQLPEDLLIDIANKLKCVEEMLAFSSICTSWKAVCSMVKPKWIPAVPWLMLPENKEGNPSCKWTVFDSLTNKRYNMELPETFDRRCWGCFDGWICTLGLDMDFHLFNPLTKARVCLPPAHTLPMRECTINYNDDGDRDWLKTCCIRSVTLVKIPPNNDLVVFVIYNLYNLAYAKPGDPCWTALECLHKHPNVTTFVEDVIGFNGQIVILYGDGKLESLGKSDLFLGYRREIFTENYVLGALDGVVSLHAEDPPYRFYLVESFGDLLVVLQYTLDCYDEDIVVDEDDKEEEKQEPRTWWFEVFKFDSAAKDWVEVDDLGDVALFVGNISSMAVSASKAYNCMPNHIYYIEDKPEPTEFKGHNLVIFNYPIREAEELDIGDDTLLKVCSPFWLMPKLM